MNIWTCDLMRLERYQISTNLLVNHQKKKKKLLLENNFRKLTNYEYYRV